jgi:hypothetical protein
MPTMHPGQDRSPAYSIMARNRAGDFEPTSINSRTHIFASPSARPRHAHTRSGTSRFSFFVISDIEMTFQMRKCHQF